MTTMKGLMLAICDPVKDVGGEIAIAMLTRFNWCRRKSLKEWMTGMD
jgi:hypothetical protein